MWMQTVNRTDVERVWINVINAEGATMTAHYPVFKITAAGNVASIATNEAAITAATAGWGTAPRYPGALLGLAYEDIAVGEQSGIVQVYGYHESILMNKTSADGTVPPGAPMGPIGLTASIGVSSAGLVFGVYGPFVALATIGSGPSSLALGAVGYGDHVFIRCL